MTSPSWQRLARVADLEGRGPFALSVGNTEIAVVRREQDWIAWSGLCPHQGALLGEGVLDGADLVCRNHGWRFDIATGKRQGGPQCLHRFPTRVLDEWLWVDASHAARSEPASGPPKSLRRYEDLPGPTGLPILGNALQLPGGSLHQVLERWAEQYGSIFRFRLGSRPFIGVADPVVMAKLLEARPGAFRRASVVEAVFEEMGVTGVFSAEGEAWRPQRRLAMRSLAANNLRAFYTTMLEVADTLLRRWEEAAQAGRVLDIQDEMMRFTIDVTTALVLGYNVRSLEDREDELGENLACIFPAMSRRLFAVVPYWRLVRLPSDRRVDRALEAVQVWLRGMTQQTREVFAAHPERRTAPRNFLEAMLTATDDRGEPFAEKVIYGNLLTMLLAGEDTTANTLAWAVYLLADAPDAVQRLRDEVTALVPAPHRFPHDFDTAQRLDFARAVADETMRLRPVAPALLFEANEETVVEDLHVDVGQSIAVLPRVPVLNPALVSEPTRFLPSRWDDSEAVARIRKAYAHIPFGSGPRICPGRSLALLEMRLVLALLYQSFDVELIPPANGEVTEHFAFTMAPRGVRVRLHRR